MKSFTAHHQNAFSKLILILSFPLVVAACAPSGNGLSSQKGNHKPNPAPVVDMSLVADSLTSLSSDIQLTVGGCDAPTAIGVVNEYAEQITARSPITFAVSSTVVSGAATVNYFTSYFHCVMGANATSLFTIASGTTQVYIYPRASGKSEFFISMKPIIFASGTMKGAAEVLGATNPVTTAYASAYKPRMVVSSTAKTGDCVGPFYVDTISGSGAPAAVTTNMSLALYATDNMGAFAGMVYQTLDCSDSGYDGGDLAVVAGRSRSNAFFLKTLSAGPIQLFARDNLSSTSPTSIGLGSTIASATITFQ